MDIHFVSTFTNAVAVGTSASTGINAGAARRVVRLAVVGNEPVYVRFDNGTPAIPAPGAASAGVMLLPNSVELFAVPAGASIRAIAGATGSTLYISFGRGM